MSGEPGGFITGKQTAFTVRSIIAETERVHKLLKLAPLSASEELARLRAMMARRTGEVPDALCCPISMEIMRDPVIAADGHTYERAEIEAWFANNRTSPKTGAVLPHGSLIPNHAAKAMISDFLDEARRHQAALDASMADEVKGAP